MGAAGRASSWSRIWIRAARVAEDIDEPTLALQYLTVAFSQNPAWVQAEIGSGRYADLGANAEFHRWVSSEQEKSAVAAFQGLGHTEDMAIENRSQIARMLLEAGHADKALVVLNAIPEGPDDSVDLRLLRSAAYAAMGDYTDATEQCNAALLKAPNQQRLRRRIARLEQEAKVLMIKQ